MTPTPRPDPRLIERLTAQIRSRDGSAAAWVAGGEALALGLLGAREAGGSLPTWADDLADTMVGSLLRVLERSVDEADVPARMELGAAAAVLSVARPHCTSVLDGAVDAWIHWTPEHPEVHHDEATLAIWTLLHLLRDDAEGAAVSAWTLCERGSGLGLLLHDWVVTRLQEHGAEREGQCFHALRAAVAGEARPTLVLLAAAVATQAAGLRRRSTLPWLDRVAAQVRDHGTSSLSPRAALRA